MNEESSQPSTRLDMDKQSVKGSQPPTKLDMDNQSVKGSQPPSKLDMDKQSVKGSQPPTKLDMDNQSVKGSQPPTKLDIDKRSVKGSQPPSKLDMDKQSVKGSQPPTKLDMDNQSVKGSQPPTKLDIDKRSVKGSQPPSKLDMDEQSVKGSQPPTKLDMDKQIVKGSQPPSKLDMDKQIVKGSQPPSKLDLDKEGVKGADATKSPQTKDIAQPPPTVGIDKEDVEVSKASQNTDTVQELSSFEDEETIKDLKLKQSNKTAPMYTTSENAKSDETLVEDAEDVIHSPESIIERDNAHTPSIPDNDTLLPTLRNELDEYVTPTPPKRRFLDLVLNMNICSIRHQTTPIPNISPSMSKNETSMHAIDDVDKTHIPSPPTDEGPGDSPNEQNQQSNSTESSIINNGSTPTSRDESVGANLNPLSINNLPKFQPTGEQMKLSHSDIPSPTEGCYTINSWQVAPLVAGFIGGVIITLLILIIFSWIMKKLEERRKSKEVAIESVHTSQQVQNLQQELIDFSVEVEKLREHFTKLEDRFLDNEKIILHQDRRFNTMERTLLTVTRRMFATDALDMSDASRTEERRRVWFLQQQVEEMKREMKMVKEEQGESKEKNGDTKRVPEWERFNDLRPRYNAHTVSPLSVRSSKEDRRGKWFEFTST